MPDLENTFVPRTAKNLDVLRRHPKLKYLGWEGDGNPDFPTLTVAEFWARYDALPKAGTK